MKLSLLAAAVILRGVFAHAQDVTVTAKDTRPDDSVTQQFMALDQECRNYVSKHDAANAVIACKRSLTKRTSTTPKLIRSLDAEPTSSTQLL